MTNTKKILKLSTIAIPLTVLILALFTFAIPASATNVDCGDTLMGDTKLDSDLDCSSIGAPFRGLIIGADDIKLDCDGHTITGPGKGNGIFLFGRTGVTIEDCHVKNFQHGFRLRFSDGNTLEDNKATNNVRGGIGIGYAMDNSDGNTFEENKAVENDFGFSIINSDNNEFRENKANNNGGFQASNFRASGFHLLIDSDGNTFKNNIADDNKRSGFRIADSGSNIFDKNKARDNDISGFHLLFSGSTLNTLEKNKACGNGIVDALQSTAGNIFVDNKFCTTSGIP